jgi:hypothetical protein
MSLKQDIRKIIARKNGLEFSMKDVNPTQHTSRYRVMLELIGSGEVVQIGRQISRTSGRFKATAELKIEAPVVGKDLPGWRDVWPECFNLQPGSPFTTL